MGDMSKPEYLTKDWLYELKRRAEKLRIEAMVTSAKADQLESLGWEFESRVAEHEKWKAKKEPQP